MNDKISHGKLMKKLEPFTIQENALKLLDNWLNNKQPRVVIINEYSEYLSVHSKVLQVSLQNTTLFSASLMTWILL